MSITNSWSLLKLMSIELMASTDVSDGIQASRPLSSLSPSAFSLYQHQGQYISSNLIIYLKSTQLFSKQLRKKKKTLPIRLIQVPYYLENFHTYWNDFFKLIFTVFYVVYYSHVITN